MSSSCAWAPSSSNEDGDMRIRLRHYPVDHEYRVAFAVRIGTRTLSIVFMPNR